VPYQSSSTSRIASPGIRMHHNILGIFGDIKLKLKPLGQDYFIF